MIEYSLDFINRLRIHELRDYARKIGVSSPTTLRKEELLSRITTILKEKNQLILSQEDEALMNSLEHTISFDEILVSDSSSALVDFLKQAERNRRYGRRGNNGQTFKNDTIILTKHEVGNEDTYYYPNDEYYALNLTLNQNPAEYDASEEHIQGYVDITPEGYGIVRAEGYFPSTRDAYMTKGFVEEYNLQKGDKVKAKAKYAILNKPKLVYEVISIDGKADNAPKFENLPYNSIGEKITPERSRFDIRQGQRTYIKNMSLNECVDLCESILKINRTMKINFINLKARPEEDYSNNSKIDFLNCLFNKSLTEIENAINLDLEKTKRDLENARSSVLVIYNFNELIKLYTALENGDCNYSKIGVTAINKLYQILSIAKNTTNNLHLNILCVDGVGVPTELVNIIEMNFKSLFNNIYENIEEIKKVY